MDSGLRTATMSEELVEAVSRKLGLMRTALT